MLGLKAFVAAVMGGIGLIPGAMLGGIVVGIRRRTTEFVLAADKADVLPIRHAVVDFIVKTGQRVAYETVRRADPVESVDDQHRPFLVGNSAGRKDLGWETFAAPVQRRHFVTVYFAGLLVQPDTVFRDRHPVVEAAVADPGVEHVSSCLGGRFQRVGDRLPVQFDAVPPRECDPEMVDRQRLYDAILLVLECQEPQDAFINRPADRKAETRVEAVTHVGEILVRQQFEQHGRHFRDVRFEIGFVPHAATRPFGFVQRLYIRYDLRLHQVGQVARQVAGGAVRVESVVFVRIIDAQRADDRVVHRRSGVGMECQR